MRHHIITCTGVRVLLQQRETCCNMNTYMSLYSAHVHCIYTLIISPCSVVYTDTCEHTCTHTSLYCTHTYTLMILYRVTQFSRTPHTHIFQVHAVVDTPSSTQALSHVGLCTKAVDIIQPDGLIGATSSKVGINWKRQLRSQRSPADGISPGYHLQSRSHHTLFPRCCCSTPPSSPPEGRCLPPA